MRYHFGEEHPAVAQKRAEDEQKVAALVGTIPAVRTVYDDGGGHGSFHKTMVATAGDDDSRSALAFFDARASRNLGDVSRPEALAIGPREVLVETPAKGKDRGQAKGQASAATPAPNATAATASAPAPAGETKSFYQRALGIFGKAEEPASPATEPAHPAAAAPATPPRRGAFNSPAAKPQVAPPAPERRASLPASALPGSQPVLPAGDTGFSRLN
jgi:hypothetical protein